MSTNTRSALRASLKQEDAALDERLPDAAIATESTASPAAAVTAASAPAGVPAPQPSTPDAPAPAAVATA
ncbi:MAG: hypothetical protein ABTQ28_19180, partial [Thauera sp.]